MNEKDFSEDEVLDIISCISKTMHYIYTNHRICHRDLKPDNILIKNGVIKLGDFATGK